MNADSQKLIAEVRENIRKLDSCAKHDFSIDLEPSRLIMKRYKCTACGGTIDSNAKAWYGARAEARPVRFAVNSPEVEAVLARAPKRRNPPLSS